MLVRSTSTLLAFLVVGASSLTGCKPPATPPASSPPAVATSEAAPPAPVAKAKPRVKPPANWDVKTKLEKDNVPPELQGTVKEAYLLHCQPVKGGDPEPLLYVLAPGTYTAGETVRASVYLWKDTAAPEFPVFLQISRQGETPKEHKIQEVKLTDKPQQFSVEMQLQNDHQNMRLNLATKAKSIGAILIADPKVEKVQAAPEPTPSETVETPAPPPDERPASSRQRSRSR